MTLIHAIVTVSVHCVHSVIMLKFIVLHMHAHASPRMHVGGWARGRGWGRRPARPAQATTTVELVHAEALIWGWAHPVL